MRPSEALSLHRTRIREIALSHRVSGVRVFGSAIRGDDVAGSDLDLLVEPTAQTTLMDIGAIRFELKNLLGLENHHAPLGVIVMKSIYFENDDILQIRGPIPHSIVDPRPNLHRPTTRNTSTP